MLKALNVKSIKSMLNVKSTLQSMKNLHRMPFSYYYITLKFLNFIAVPPMIKIFCIYFHF